MSTHANDAPVRRMFGTDGVRDVANRGNMTPETAFALGRSFVRYLALRGGGKYKSGGASPSIVVCRDTRISGPMIEAALAAGMMSEGASVLRLGVFPTPGASFVLRHGDHDAGAVISASHNPFEYNGIKFFDHSGTKLTDTDEAMIERMMGEESERPDGARIGTSRDARELRDGYTNGMKKLASTIDDTSWPIVIDAANGAACDTSRDVFASWRGEVSFCGVSPNGTNINDGVGVMHLDNLRGEVERRGARLGIAYDGDADRVLLCDSRGRTIDGDVILWVVARHLANVGALGAGVVATVMSNMVLEEKLTPLGIEVFRCPVGDRYVLERMKEVGSRLGGEQSGHVIASDIAGTGDGLCTGLFFIKACEALDEDISTLVDRFPRWPQVLRNLKIEERAEVLAHHEMKAACAEWEARLAGAGRVFIRTSGTEPLLRILVEARDESLMNEAADALERAAMEVRERVRKN